MTTATAEAVLEEPKISRRRLRETGRGHILRPFDQVRQASNYGPDVDAVGAYAYYIRLDGETISDALILNPNGGRPPQVGDEKQRRRRKAIGNMSEYYQQRQLNKLDELGQPLFEYIGPRLTESAVRRLVEVIMGNREDGILYAQETIAECEQAMETGDSLEIKAQARRRKGQFEKRLAYLTQELDADEMIEELNQISRAQRLANLPAGVLDVMREMVGDVREDFVAMLSSGRASKAHPKGARPAAATNLGEALGDDD